MERYEFVRETCTGVMARANAGMVAVKWAAGTVCPMGFLSSFSHTFRQMAINSVSTTRQ